MFVGLLVNKTRDDDDNVSGVRSMCAALAARVANFECETHIREEKIDVIHDLFFKRAK